jgi:polyisoprenoid-binding protein YceI
MKKIILAFILMMLPLPVLAATPVWVIDHDKRKLTFTAIQQGGKFDGTIGKFDGVIIFDSKNLAGSSANIIIDPSSINTDDAERDGQLQGADWFSTATFPTAKFVTTKFTQGTDGSYTALGNLTLRDVTLPVALPFTLVFNADQSEVVMTGTVKLDRLAFGIGQGQWMDISSVGKDVTVKISLSARKSP